MVIHIENLNPPGAKIKVIGIGGGGGNAVNTMIRSGLEGVEFIAANTDIQALNFSLASKKVQLGKDLTKGLGAGSDPDIGRDAVLEDRHELQEALGNADMVFLTAGMGGGTGTGGIPVIAQIAREAGALTVAVVTLPFIFEGKRRKKHAESGLTRLRESVDTLITIPNERLLYIIEPNLTLNDAFRIADEVLLNAVRGVSDIINIPGIVNVDFADVKTIMSGMGQALMGIGYGSGERRAIQASKKAIASPLLENMTIDGATGILINITASSDISLLEINEACSIIQESAHEDANIIFGTVIDEKMGDEVRITVIATGFPLDDEKGFFSIPKFKASRAFSDQPKNDPYQETFLAPPQAAAAELSPSISIESLPEPSDKTLEAPANPELVMEFSKPQQPPSPEPLPLSQNETKVIVASPPAPDEDTPTPVPVSVVAEAQELAKWTLGSFSDNELSEEKEPEITPSSETITEEKEISLQEDLEVVANVDIHLPETTSDSIVLINSEPEPLLEHHDDDTEFLMEETVDLFSKEDKRIQGASLASELEVDDEKNNLKNIVSITEENSSATITAEVDLFDTAKKNDHPLESMPLEMFFDNENLSSDLVQDIDKRIDEALQIAEDLAPKLDIPKLDEDENDGLDIPAFLRNGAKDLPSEK